MEVSDVPQKSDFVSSKTRARFNLGIAFYGLLGRVHKIPSLACRNSDGH